MFHVKPELIHEFSGKSMLLLLFFLSISGYCFSQKGKALSAGLSLDYSFGNDYNNYASSVRLNYNIFENVRLSPSFSYYLNDGDKKMMAFSLTFHYMMSEVVEKKMPVIMNQGIYLYPVAGFFISSFSHPKQSCNSCSTTPVTIGTNYNYNFGFNFGVGAEYELPTLLPLLRDMNVSFEMQYIIVDTYARPSVSLGLIYNF